LWEKPLVKLGILPTDGIPIVTKTLTLKAKRGNPYSVRFINEDGKEGVFNKVGLHNPGLEYWIKHYYSKTKDKDVIVSISASSISEYLWMIKKLETLDIKGIELNVSCPNIEDNLSRSEVIKLCNRLETNHPIILKLRHKYFDTFVFEHIKDKVDAISINSYQRIEFNYGRISDNSGAYSGQIVQSENWEIADSLKQKFKIPVIYCSIWTVSDIFKLMERKADAISFGSVVLRHPFRVRNIMKEYTKLEDKGEIITN